MFYPRSYTRTKTHKVSCRISLLLGPFISSLSFHWFKKKKIIVLYILYRKEFGRKRSSESDKWKLKWVMLINALRLPKRHKVLGSRGRMKKFAILKVHTPLSEWSKKGIMKIEQLSWIDKGLWTIMESVCFSLLKEAKLSSIGGKYYGFGQ